MASHILSLSLILSTLPLGLAFSPPHPCIAYPTKVSKLRNCATASSFCSTFLGGPASFTRTSTSTTTVQSTITDNTVSTSTSTSYTTTVFEADPTSTFTITSATSTDESETTSALSCDAGSNDSKRFAKRSPQVAAAAAASSCGIARGANASKVSGACNCILASSTSTTATATSGTTHVPSSITTSVLSTESTSTTISTTTTYLTTVSACTPCPSFVLQAVNAADGSSVGYVQLSQDMDDNANDPSATYSNGAYLQDLSEIVTQFQIDDGTLVPVPGLLYTFINNANHFGNLHDADSTFFFNTQVNNAAGASFPNCKLQPGGTQLQCSGRRFPAGGPLGTFQTCTSGAIGCTKRDIGCIINKRIAVQVGSDLRFYPDGATVPGACTEIKLEASCATGFAPP